MRSLLYSTLGLVLVCFMGSITGCAKKDVKSDDTLSGSMDSGAKGENGEDSGELKIAYFDFDSHVLTRAARAILKKNGEYLKANKSVSVQIEGFCDERGTTEYNLALGEKRAIAAKNYLTRLGVDGSRISVISYGKERPVDPGHDEAAWAKNRRTAFVVLTQHLGMTGQH